MARQRNVAKAKPPKAKDGGPPAPFKRPAEVFQPFIDTLNQKHVYIAHIDSKPWEFKRKIFAVPVLMNVGITVLFVWRMFHIGPYYLNILASVLGYPNEMTMVVDEMSWEEIVPEVGMRAFTFTLDFLLFMFIWSWPVDFCLAQDHGNPLMWRWNVGFRDKEVVVRRSRKWTATLGDVVHDTTSKSMFMGQIGLATSPLILGEKTGYLLVNADWDLDWAAMIDCTTMVDKKMAAIEAFTVVVLIFHEEYGWLTVDMKEEAKGQEDLRRRQVFLFRDALRGVGKEDLFYRWIETIQYESSQPGGFGPEKQEAVAIQIREMFEKQDINFDEFWKESVGSEATIGLQA